MAKQREGDVKFDYKKKEQFWLKLLDFEIAIPIKRDSYR